MNGIELVADKQSNAQAAGLLKHAFEDVFDYLEEATDNGSLSMQDATFRAYRMVKAAVSNAWEDNVDMQINMVWSDNPREICEAVALRHAIEDVLNWLWLEHDNDAITLQPATRRALITIQTAMFTED